MRKMEITYKDLLEAHESKMIGYDKAYVELILPIKDTWREIDSVIDFVRRWNSRVPVGKNKEKIKEIILSLKSEFDSLKDFNLETFEFNMENIRIVKKIFNTLSKTILKHTGTTKLMHGMNPNLFVMWDKGICITYGVYPNSEGYIIFLKLMQEKILGILKEKRKEYLIKKTGKSLPKLLDEYNWTHFKTSISIKNE